MTKTCGCGCGTHGTVRGPEARPAPARVAPTDTVESVASRSPRALEAMKALGLNHCCGAHLSLVEAAASAGVPLETVLARLDDALAAEVPV